MSDTCYICKVFTSDKRASLAQHICSCRKLLSAKSALEEKVREGVENYLNNNKNDRENGNDLFCDDDDIEYEIVDEGIQDDKNEIVDVDINDDHDDSFMDENSSIQNAPPVTENDDDNSMQPLQAIDTTTYLDAIEEDCLLEYFQYTQSIKVQKELPISDSMIAAIELLTIFKNAKASLVLYNKIVDWVLHCKASITKKCLPQREKVIKMLVIDIIYHA